MLLDCHIRPENALDYFDVEAAMAERKLKGHAADPDELREEIAPVFRESRQTDVVVLGCTHYPLLTRGSASETLAAYGALGFPQHVVVDLPV